MTLDHVEFPCARCGRPLSAIPGTRYRKCAACGKKSPVPGASEPVPAVGGEPAFEGRRVVWVREVED